MNKLLKKMKNNAGKVVAFTASSAGILLMPEMAMAITAPVAPATGAVAPLGYEVYDVAVNDLLKGPIGFVVGLGTIIFGALQITKSWPIALMSVLGGTVIIKADAVVTSLGALI